MSTPKYHGDINCASFILFFKVLQNGEFHSRFPDGKYNMSDFLRYVRESSGDNAKVLVTAIQFKASG